MITRIIGRKKIKASGREKAAGNLMLLLHDIRSVHNVGSIFRTADGAGVTKIYLSGYTPAPVDRFGRARADLAKVALGAEKAVEWEVVSGIDGATGTDSFVGVTDFIKKMKKACTSIIALEQDERAVDYRTAGMAGNVKEDRESVFAQRDKLLILGNEVDGVSRDLLDLADVVIEIPMRGEKESLNVSVAAGIAMYALVG